MSDTTTTASASAAAAAARVRAAADSVRAAAEASVQRFCGDIASTRSLDRARRLWDWIDAHPEPESMWAIMLREIPWAFSSSSPNSIL